MQAPHPVFHPVGLPLEGSALLQVLSRLPEALPVCGTKRFLSQVLIAQGVAPLSYCFHMVILILQVFWLQWDFGQVTQSLQVSISSYMWLMLEPVLYRQGIVQENIVGTGISCCLQCCHPIRAHIRVPGAPLLIQLPARTSLLSPLQWE